MNYKEVFKLAKHKGYLPFGYIDYYELCRIQKWLRDEYAIHITIRIDFGSPIWYDWIIPTREGEDILEENTFYLSYEEALLTGVSEALKLIKPKEGA